MTACHDDVLAIDLCRFQESEEAALGSSTRREILELLVLDLFAGPAWSPSVIISMSELPTMTYLFTTSGAAFSDPSWLLPLLFPFRVGTCSTTKDSLLRRFRT